MADFSDRGESRDLFGTNAAAPVSEKKKKRTFGYNKILLLEQKLRRRLTAQETAAVLWVQTPICSLALHNC